MIEKIQMNAFTPSTNGAYIYAEADNGSQVKIKKSDLVELIRADMPVASPQNKGLMPSDGFLQGKHINIDIYNNMITAGAYSHTDNIGSGITTGVLFVICGQQYSVHIDIGNFSSVHIKTLRSNGELLKDWRSITFT